MAQQILNIGAAGVESGDRLEWGLDNQIDAAFIAAGMEPAYLRRFRIDASSGVQLRTADTPTGTSVSSGPQLTGEWEENETAIIVSSGDLSVVIPGPNASSIGDQDDVDEPYDWNDDAFPALLGDFVTAYRLLPQAQKNSTTVTLNDEASVDHAIDAGAANFAFDVPELAVTLTSLMLQLTDFDRTGLTVEVLALIVADSNMEPYNASGGLGTVEPGSDLVLDRIPITVSRIRTGTNTITLNRSGSVAWRSHFPYISSPADRTYSDSTLHIQTGAGLVSIPVVATTDPAIGGVRSAGSGFIVFNIPTGGQSIIDGIMAGERFIIALARQSTAHLVDIGAVNFSFDLPEPTVTLTPSTNQDPVANAGPNQNVAAGVGVTLDGSGSSDPDGTIALYLWTQTFGPDVTLNNAGTDSPSFTAPSQNIASILVFRLTVTDNDGAIDTDDVTVDVAAQTTTNQAPVANAGLNQSVAAGVGVTLDGSGSSDPDGDPITYLWSQVSGPNVTLSGRTSATPTFTAPSPNSSRTLVFRLQVSDDGQLIGTDTVTIAVAAVVAVVTALPTDEYVTLVEIDFSSGTRRYSFSGASTPQGWYADKILRIGNISRQVSLLPGAVRVASTTLELKDLPDREFSKLKDTESFRGRQVRFLFGLVTGQRTVVFSGRVIDYRLRKGTLILSVRDSGYDRFRSEVEGRLNGVTDFPNLPAQQDLDLYPIGYGDLSGSDLGTVPAIRIGSTASPFRYLLFRHPCFSVDRVLVDGVPQLSGWTATLVIVNGQEMQFVDFNIDPGEDAVITADVQGKMDEYGNLLENPVSVQEDFLLNYTNTEQEELDESLYNEARQQAENAGYKASVWIGGDAIKKIDVINRLSESFVMPSFVSRLGKFAVALLTDAAYFNADGTAIAPDVKELTDQDSIIRDTFEIVSNFRYAAARIHYLYAPRWPSGKSERGVPQEKAGEADRLGEDLVVRHDLIYIRDSDTAHRTTAVRLLVSGENQQIASFRLPVSEYNLELSEQVYLTHYQGIASSGLGYVRALFRILDIDISLQPRSARVDVTAARVLDSSPHCDSHTDVHTDADHQNVHLDMHLDVTHIDSHTDSLHADAPHADAEHSDTVPHGDAHGDGVDHDDGHSDRAHVDRNDGGSPQHSDIHNDQSNIHADYIFYEGSPVERHFDSFGGHIDGHNDLIMEVSHTDSHSDDTDHSDNHNDSQGDHSDVGHGDSDHSDAGHEDSFVSVPHGDAFTNLHEDAQHVDTEHVDFHCDTENPHGDQAGEPSHQDIYHSDTHVDDHSDVHSDAHSDDHTDILHEDVEHADSLHSDTPHEDDSHSDSSHSDTSHTNRSHSNRSHADEESGGHTNTPHVNTSHQDSHTNTPHVNTSHQDSHTNTPHVNTSHQDSHTDDPHVNTSHQDSHTDDPHVNVSHQDSHTDDPHVNVSHQDSHTNTPHVNTSHQDSHTDDPPVNVSHSNVVHMDAHDDIPSDMGHSDAPHENVAHGDMDHGDVDHADVDHGDMDHGDVDHADVDHGDMDHGDVDHADVDHGDMDHGDVDHADVDHGDMDHGDVDHADVDHGDMDHGDVDHADVDHGDMDHGDVDHADVDHGDMDHGDMSTESHQNTAHANTSHLDTDHGDTDHGDGIHSDVDHEDADHDDTTHEDTAHLDSHADFHGDSL